MAQFDYRKYISENKFILGEVKSKNFERNTIIEARLKDDDITVGSKFELPNGEIIDIKKVYKDKDLMFVNYIRSGGSSQQGKNDNSVKSLRIFLNNWKAKKIK